MGIFIEDLLNFGNLIDTEVEVPLKPEDFRRVFPDLSFEFSESILKIKGKKKVLFFNKGFEFRGREESDKVFNERTDELKDFGIFVKVVSSDGIDVLEKDSHFKKEGEYLRMSLLDVLKATETYQKIPKQFRDKLELVKYRIKEGALSIFITVVK
ncbi:hypothetical protein [Aquifex sp.]